MWARQLMSSTVRTVTAHDSVADAARIMRASDVGMLPVVDDPSSMHLVGVITDRDIAVRCVADGHEPTCRVGTHMTSTKLATVGPDSGEDEVIAKMEVHQVRRLPVVEMERLVGVIAQADIATRLGPHEPEKVEHLLETVSAHAAVV